jgi:citrate/tricarballylate utilization protein
MNQSPLPQSFSEARRAFEICNACRYCEGYCPVFPDMFARRDFSDGDISHLSNLCHNCKGCWHACQYAPPHEFGLNLPATLATVRAETYAKHAWPRAAGRLFQKNGAFVAMATALAIFAVILGAMLLVDGTVMTAVHRGEGAFYAVIPHNVMVWLGTLTFGWGIFAMLLGVRSYWRGTGGGPVPLSSIGAALRDAATTRHLGGRGEGCNDLNEGFSQARRHFHLATMWGFLLCFAATSLATVMDYGLGWQAPYSWYSLPVVFGTVGGVMLMIGTAGLFWVKVRTDRAPEAEHLWGMDVGLLALLFFTAATGLALLFWRHTSAMGWLLALHLGFVLALFVTLPYGKFVHGLYRLAALIRYHRDRPSA